MREVTSRPPSHFAVLDLRDEANVGPGRDVISIPTYPLFGTNFLRSLVSLLFYKLHEYLANKTYTSLGTDMGFCLKPLPILI